MSVEIPQVWVEKIASDLNVIRESGPKIFTPEDLSHPKKTLSVLMIPNPESREFLTKVLTTVVPEDLRQYLIFQPTDGFHISIQWTSQFEPQISSDLITSITDIISQQPPLTGRVIAPFVSRPNLFAVVDFVNQSQLGELRYALTNVYSQFGLTGALPNNLDTSWVSLAKFVEVPPADVIERLANLQVEDAPINVSEIIVAINDPLLRLQNSTILKRVHLK